MKISTCWLGVTTLLALLFSLQASATSFAILLDGMDASEGIQAISLDAALVETGGLRGVFDGSGPAAQGFRRALPPNHHFINLRLTGDFGVTGEFVDWFKKIRNGDVNRRTINVRILSDDHSVVMREFNLFDCEPDEVTMSPPGADGTPGPETYSITARGIEFLGGGRPAAPSDGRVGLVVDGLGQKEPWISWSGGEPALILTPLFEAIKDHVAQPGAKTVTPIILGGSAAIQRPVLFSWLNDAFQGNPSKSRAGVSSPGPNGGRSIEFTYGNCLPMQYSIQASKKERESELRDMLEMKTEFVALK